MKLHKGDKVLVIKRIAFNWTPYLEIHLNGYLQYNDSHEYMLKRCGVSETVILNELAKDEAKSFTI